MAISTAVPLNRVSAVVGYEINPSLEGIAAGVLPQRIAIVGEKASTHQNGAAELEFTSAKQVGLEYGFDSPLYAAARILRPLSGDVLGSIPTVCYSVHEAAGAVAKSITKTITGTATKTLTHFMRVNGRTQLDGHVFSFSILAGETATEIAPKMRDALNGALGICGTASVDVSDNLVFTAGWAGLSSNEVNIEIDVNGDAAGLTYSESATTAGSGDPALTSALALFGNEWSTMIVNCVNRGTADANLDAFETFIGNPNDGTGRYLSTEFVPPVSFFGDNSVNTVSLAQTLGSGRETQVANSFCAAPNSKGLSFEAAANFVTAYAPIAQSTPHIDPIGLKYPDMPVPETIGEFADSTNRDLIVKAGCSTAKLNGNSFEIVDQCTTYHPDDEPETASLFRFVKDLIGIDFNARYLYMLYEQIYVIGKTIISDNGTTRVSGTVSAAKWQSILATQYGPRLEELALMTDIDYFRNSIQVGIGESNPNRFETSFKMKRTGTVRVASTTNQTQFNFN